MDVKNMPIAARKAIKKLGLDLRDARRRRRIPMRLAAERAGISRTTLTKVEKGDEGVAIGAYARVLFVLGLVNKLEELADAHYDRWGLAVEAETLPKRIRLSKGK